MKYLPMLASLTFCLVLVGEARGEKLVSHVTPKSQESLGFAVVQEPRDKGLVRVTITRELAKARSFSPDSDLELRRSSTLRVYDDSGLSVECPVTGTSEKGKIVYWFTVAKAQLAKTHFTVAEIDDYKPSELREHLIGGGTYFEFNLEDFIAEPAHTKTVN